MAMLTFALLLAISLPGCASTSTPSTDDLMNLPEVQRIGDPCKDCTQIFDLLADLLSNPTLQKKILNGVESLCDHLPGPETTAKICRAEVDKMLPLAFTFITGLVKPTQVCKMIGLCGSCENQKMLSYFVNEALQSAGARTNEEVSTQCTFCLFLVKTLEDMLPKASTEKAVINLLEEVCQILPPTYRKQCEAIVDKFSKTVLDAILGYATPHAVCALIQMCKGEEVPLVDPCSLATFRCKDMNTAIKCGTVFYCQKFAWKPLSYNTM